MAKKAAALPSPELIEKARAAGQAWALKMKEGNVDIDVFTTNSSADVLTEFVLWAGENGISDTNGLIDPFEDAVRAVYFG